LCFVEGAGGRGWAAQRQNASVFKQDAPVSRLVQRAGVIRSRAILGRLYHHYDRI
jgi:hypothetical protein